MSIDEPNDDEDWYDDNDLDDKHPASCPECGRPIHSIADHCSACGYWLSDADRRATWTSDSRPRWVTVTAVVVLAAFVLSVLGIATAIF